APVAVNLSTMATPPSYHLSFDPHSLRFRRHSCCRVAADSASHHRNSPISLRRIVTQTFTEPPRTVVARHQVDHHHHL
ncbi:hypothetical protein VIGAN_11077800, partial [Vigna angularis var. angularis]